MAAVLSGLSFDMGGEVLAGLGIGIALGNVTIGKVKEILNHIKFKNTLDDHTVRKDHLFDEFCGPECIKEAETNIKEVIENKVYKDGVGHIHFLGNCHHGCTIKIKLTFPPSKTFWDISTAHHVGPCLANKNLFKYNE